VNESLGVSSMVKKTSFWGALSRYVVESTFLSQLLNDFFDMYFSVGNQLSKVHINKCEHLYPK
jgi:hypothetical protein